MNRKRLLMRTLAILLGTVVLLLLVGTFALGSIVRVAAVKLGGQMLKTPVAIESCRITPWNGRIVMRGFSIDNPDGYSSDKLAAFDELIFQVSIPSVLDKTQPIIINEITIRGPRIAYETKTSQPSNFDALMEALKSPNATAPEAASGASEAPQDAPEEPAQPRKVIIEHFEMAGGKISYRAGLLANRAIPLPLPTIRLDGIGAKSQGVSAVEAISEIMISTGKGIVEAVADAATGIGSGLKEMGKTLQKLL
ncbi:MAG: hypothetical protein SPK06_05535 [Kiritimatiellia bacterium]|nr:hypothetical protein [Kiritimatiellia bacterium]